MENLQTHDSVNAESYDKVSYKKFCDDMEQAGLDVIHYNGRWFYCGPAVIVDDLQESLSETKVSCQWDNMGLGYVVYPK